jgi:fatty acid desaturase
MSERVAVAGTDFSVAVVRPFISDLFVPNPAIYWTDFLLSIGGGHICFALVRLFPYLFPDQPWVYTPLCLLAFAGSVLLYYRSAMFIHELVHLKRGSFRAFRFVWNLLCGIPLLMPSFVYYHHVEHHRRSLYGTGDDGEYLPLEHSPPWHILIYFTRPLFVPFLVVLRFVLLTPLAWISPSIRQWVHRRASSVVLNPGYVRPPANKQELRSMRLQETLCFLWCVGLIVLPLIFLGRLPVPLMIHSYLTAVCVLAINGFRTLGQHRWTNQGGMMTWEEQFVDSLNYPYRPFITELWGPIGLRFHGLHHIFPTMPYHALAEAHRRLMRQLPADSPYRLTVRPSLLGALGDLWQRARRSSRHRTVATGEPPSRRETTPA